jgi:hypothetical protein
VSLGVGAQRSADFRAQRVAAGEATGTLAVSFEADDYASIGAVTDKLLADPEGMELLMQTNSASGPIAAFKSSIWSDIEV